MGFRQPAVSAGRGKRDCLAVVPPARSPARASALARTKSGSRGSSERTSCHGYSRQTLGRRIRICCTVSHLPGQPPHPGVADGGQPGLVGLALPGTVRIRAAVARHPKVATGWSFAWRRSVTRRCYRAGWGGVTGSVPAAGPVDASVRLAAPSLPKTWIMPELAAGSSRGSHRHAVGRGAVHAVPIDGCRPSGRWC